MIRGTNNMSPKEITPQKIVGIPVPICNKRFCKHFLGYPNVTQCDLNKDCVIILNIQEPDEAIVKYVPCFPAIQALNEENEQLKTENEQLKRVLTQIERGCSFPADDVQKAIRDVARTALAKQEDE